jgi:hypothetical protein
MHTCRRRYPDTAQDRRGHTNCGGLAGMDDDSRQIMERRWHMGAVHDFGALAADESSPVVCEHEQHDGVCQHTVKSARKRLVRSVGDAPRLGSTVAYPHVALGSGGCEMSQHSCLRGRQTGVGQLPALCALAADFHLLPRTDSTSWTVASSRRVPAAPLAVYELVSFACWAARQRMHSSRGMHQTNGSS